MRTIVFSDVHGEPAVIRRILEHSGYRPGCDRLIFAGDAVEVGVDSGACLELLEELGVEYLVGNHEYSIWNGDPIEPERIDEHVHAAIVCNIDAGRWVLAANVGSTLITHAGVCNAVADELGEGVSRDVVHLVERLNHEFSLSVALGPDSSHGDVFEADGPLWYRPSEHRPPLDGIVQVAGHTPPEILWTDNAANRLAARGVFLIDPFVRRWVGHGRPTPVPARYAVIEHGRVRVFQEGI